MEFSALPAKIGKQNFGSRVLKGIFISLFLLFNGISAINAQSNHTVSFSGAASDFNTAEKYSAAANSTDYYITFDASNLYLGAFRTSGDRKSVV